MTGATSHDGEAAADRAAARGDFTGAERILARLAERDDEPAIWMKLASMRRKLADLEGALAATLRALRHDPLAFLPLLFRARLLDLQQSAEAPEAFAVALQRAPDQRNLPPPLIAEIEHARRVVRTFAEQRLHDLTQDIGPALAIAKSHEHKRLSRFIANVAKKSRSYAQQPTHFAFPGLATIEFFDPLQFVGVKELEADTASIREELRAILAARGVVATPYVQYPEHVPLDQWRALNHSSDWTAIHLVRNGEIVEENARHCPRTMQAYARLDRPCITGRGPNLMFSLLAPKTRIPPHTGVSNTRLVIHLPLVVPPTCGFRVGGETIAWEVGKAIVFDDTIEHEAWNESDQLRVVLIGDLWRPDLSEAERVGVSIVLAGAQAMPLN